MINLDDIVRFGEESNKLIEKSPYSENIKALLSMPELGKLTYHENKAKPYFEQQSNCHGTLFYVLGLGNLNFPRFADRSLMKKFLEENCELGKEENGIITFSSLSYGLQHSGLYLGEAADKDVMFHQPGTGKEYGLHPTTEYPKLYPQIGPISFYKFKKKTNLWVPPYLNEKEY